jgi:tetratricopeptide (TPR) repeat protein
MKRFWVLITVFVLLSGCHRPTPAVETVYTPALQPELAAIDTLMQISPDSALTLLLDSTMNDPYYQLLLSEALYKNDYAQANRAELLDVMAFFDSVHDPFLSARCHYMNGVGYFEMDSVVSACEEYMKAIQIMEEYYPEKELVGLKAKYLALTFAHLCDLFSKQYLHVQAIDIAKESYKYFKKSGPLSWQSAWVLNTIGAHYNIMEQWDSAVFYCQKAIADLNDTNCLMFRDISTQLTILEYEMGDGCEKPLHRLKHLLNQAETDNEYYARCLAVGDVFYHTKEFDSAMVYLEKTFTNSSNVSLKIQAAEMLVEILKDKDEFVETRPYADYLIPFANLNEGQSLVKSQFTDIYQKYEQSRKENHHQLQVKKNQKRFGLIMGVVAACLILVAILYLLRTKQLKNERREHKIKNAALSGKLKQSHSLLKKEREENKKKATLFINTDHDTDIEFEDEPICHHIITICNDIKNPIKSNIAVSAYADIALTRAQEAQLKDAVNRHFAQFFSKLKALHPELKSKDFLYCYLSLLGLDNIQIAAMTQLSYRTIWEREKRLQRIFDTNDKISVVLHGFLIN